VGSTLRVITWNVNGLRACAKKGFCAWLAGSGADIVGVQEVRAREGQLPEDVRAPAGYVAHVVAGERAGYSGVALFSKRAPDWVETGLGEPRFDVEGRTVIAGFGRLAVLNAYFPKGSGNERDNSRVPYKLDFYEAALERADRLRRGGYRVLVIGDMNTAHTEIDLARPKDNVKNSGFLPEERAAFDRWIDAGWVDTFRHFVPEGGHYTWWRQWGGARERNVGWRIDYILASGAAMRYATDARILPDVPGSDHAPMCLELDAGVLG
jgi:exodeoxyribonuclease III